MIEIPRRDIRRPWNTGDEPNPPEPESGVTTSADISRCTDLTILSIDEILGATCMVANSVPCEIITTYSPTYYNDKNGASFLWLVESGNAAIDGDSNKKEVKIKSTSLVSEPFVLKITITDGDGNQIDKTENFEHIRN